MALTVYEEQNLFYGLSPKEFVAVLDKQVNLKQMMANANDPFYGKDTQKIFAQAAAAQGLLRKGTNHTSKKSIISSKTNPQPANSKQHASTIDNSSQMRDTVLSNMSTATDRLKKML